MTAFNVVRFRVKPGREQEFLDAQRGVRNEWSGLKKVNMIKTGDRTYCIIAEWADMADLVANRPNMIATLDTSARHWETSAAASASPIRSPGRSSSP
jgi:hypothetical protein